MNLIDFHTGFSIAKAWQALQILAFISFICATGLVEDATLVCKFFRFNHHWSFFCSLYLQNFWEFFVFFSVLISSQCHLFCWFSLWCLWFDETAGHGRLLNPDIPVLLSLSTESLYACWMPVLLSSQYISLIRIALARVNTLVLHRF